MPFNMKKIVELGSRVTNNKMIEDKTTGISDAKDIKEYCSRVFGDGTVTPDPSALHQFNNIVVQNADEIAKPMATDLLGLFADFKTLRPGDVYGYIIPGKIKAKVKWAASGTGVDLVRVESGKRTVATPKTFMTGYYYEPLDMVQDSVENYRKLVQDVANAKLRLYLTAVQSLITTAIANGKIPTNNVKTGSGLKLADYNKVASIIARVGYGGRPIFVADTLLIDYFAMQQVTDPTAKELLFEGVKEDLLTSLNITNIGRTTAVNLVNPFIDDTNSAVELPVNEGYFFAPTVSQKPVVVVEYGGLRQSTEQDPEDERIKMIIRQEAAIEMVQGAGIGYIKEDDTTKVGL